MRTLFSTQTEELRLRTFEKVLRIFCYKIVDIFPLLNHADIWQVEILDGGGWSVSSLGRFIPLE
jgi:hypothetical protein